MKQIISGANIPTPDYSEYATDVPILAYIVNIGMLGEDIVNGKWLPFPTTPESVKEVLNSIGIDGDRYKRFIVADYFTIIAGLDMILPASPCMNELNLLANFIDNMECEEMDIFEAALELKKPTEMAEIINTALNIPVFEYIPDVADEDELGRYCVENFDFCDVPGIDEFLLHVNHYFYGISKQQDENGIFVDVGYISAEDDIPTIYSGLSDLPDEAKLFTDCPCCQ